MKMLLAIMAILFLAGCASQDNTDWAQISKAIGMQRNH